MTRLRGCKRSRSRIGSSPKYKCSCAASVRNRLTAVVSRANSLGHFAVFYNDPGLINLDLEPLRANHQSRSPRVAQTYFRESNRTVVTTLPKSAAGESGKIQ